MFEYNLFEYQNNNLSEYHFVLYDGYKNKRDILVFAMSFSDALEQARKRALHLGYSTPYTWGRCDVYR